MTKKPARKSPAASRIGQVRGHVGEAKARAAADSLQRQAAGKAPNTIILRPEDVRGKYDAARALETTLGGVKRKLTVQDLADFRRNMRTLQGKITKRGITARQVIDLAADNPHRYAEPAGNIGDLGKARREIKWATPVSALPAANNREALDVRFLTDSGEDSKVTRHHCIVRFLDYGEQVRRLQSVPLDPGMARAEKAITAKKAAVEVRDGYLAIECSCDRFRYVYRYIASVGGFNAGRDETGYPKLTNASLEGVACKHLLKCMAEISSSRSVLKFLEQVLAKAMASRRVQHTLAQADAEALAKRQSRNPGDIKTTADRNDSKARQQILRAMATAPPRAKPVVLSKLRQRQLAQLAESLGLAPGEAMRRLLGNS